VPLDGLHDDRNRAESFGSVAEEYDRYRPGYPEAFVADLLAGSPSNVLDVGCGTGKVAAPILQRGIRVLGVEPDPRMAEVARRHHVPVEVASFESWDPAGRTFDLLTAGHSWHWIDPAIGLTKAASVVSPGGIAALFWNYHVVDDDLLSAFDAAYRSHAPELAVVGRDPSGAEDTDPFEGSTAFRSLGSRTYRWPRALAADEWTRMLATFSDHAQLGDARLTLLRQTLHEAIEQSGGLVNSQCGTYVWTARRVEGSAK
jgi:SAM-dependent methyltransferase